jgi:hypothetical protein
MSLITVDRELVLELRKQADYAVMIMDCLTWLVEKNASPSQIEDYITDRIEAAKEKLSKASDAELFKIEV